MKKSAFALVAVLCILMTMFPAPVLAASGDMETTGYNVLVNVNDDKSAVITEEINVNFVSYMHGILRYIPYRGVTTEQVNGEKTVTKYRNRISDVFVSGYQYQTYEENGFEVIQIGNPDQTIQGPYAYQFSYLYEMTADPYKDFDTLYLNVIPTKWDSDINSAVVTINMPKAFDAKNVEVFSGGGTAGNTQMSVDGNTIKIISTERLAVGEGITVRVVLPEDYFSGELSYAWIYYLIYGILVLGIFLLGFFWFRFGRDPKHVQTVEFEPPEGITPAELGYIIDGVSDKNDMVSLIIYFAHKGYLTISPVDDSNKDFILTKLVELPESCKTYEHTFFNGLFENSLSGVVRLSELGEAFYPSFTAAKSQLQQEFIMKKENRIFALSSIAARVGAFAIILLAIAGVFMLIGFLTGSVEVGVFSLASLIPLLMSYLISCSEYDKKYIRKKATQTMTSIVSIVLLLVGVGAAFGIVFSYSDHILAASLVAALAVAGYPATRYMKRRTKKGAVLLGKILGFKEFIRVAEVDRIKKLVEQNPAYFYDILPYAYVLGLSKKWAQKFENIAMEPPTWYTGSYGNHAFTTLILLNSLDNATRVMSDSIVIPTSSSGSGGSFSGGGGGFSGGGMGGGGGGGW
jgi:uncharacterized membrane protein YgcG